jgi:serine/threonine protein kinase/Tfp pilus assembly protein PilF
VAVKCPKCDTTNPSDSKYCKECATPLPSGKVSVTRTLETPPEVLSRGTTFANRYEILEVLGSGGMGKVYRALDKKLDEEVALKLINPQIASDKRTLKRFSNELKVARKISHKNIGRMYELMEGEGTHFITMEFVPGEDLKSFILRSGQMAVGTTLRIATQVCEGLIEAHKSGIVHRDLKPSNIMIDKQGNAKIMDFGIARSLKTKGITSAGAVIGTPEYMSPEQAEAKEADHRSDIYSLGIVLYEMLTGQLPFEGDTPLSIAMKQKGEIPKDPKELNPQIPDELSNLILKCLEKEKEKRFQSTEEIIAEMGRLVRNVPTAQREVPRRKPLSSKEITVSFNLKKLLIPGLILAILLITVIIFWQLLPKKEALLFESGRPSIAVLPFDDLSQEKDQEAFCLGFAESLINAFSKIEDLRIPAKTSSFSFKGKERDLEEIGEKLDVATVLMGSVQKAENRIRITAQLVKIADASIIWSDQFNREMNDIFSIQDDISVEIVKKLKGTLLGEEKENLTKRYTENAEAYNLYLQGRFFWEKRTGEGFNKAVDCFEQAIEIDPDYAQAYVGLAYTYGTFAGYGFLSLDEATPKIKTLLEKALTIDDEIAEAHTLKAQMQYVYDLDWEGAEKEFKLALQLNPNSMYAHMWYAIYLGYKGQLDNALEELTRAYELDPLNIVVNYGFGAFQVYARRYDIAIQAYEKTLSMDQNFVPAYVGLGKTYLMQSKYEEALEELDKAWQLSKGSSSYVLSLKGMIHAKSGNRTEAEKRLQELKAWSQHRYVDPAHMAVLFMALGQNDQAFDWLEKAYSGRSAELTALNIDPLWDDLRPDPRFSELLRKIGLE